MMVTLVTILFLPLVLCWSLWLILVLAGLRKERPAPVVLSPSARRLHVLIPAHNEELLISVCLNTVLRQDHAEMLGTILVVADHCTDATAAIARNLGATVLDRNSGPRGKPAALRDGLAYLREKYIGDHDAVMVLDGDCRISPNAVGLVLLKMEQGATVLQLENEMDETTGLQDSVGRNVSLGYMLKNVLRARGASRLGIPTQLFGTGMIFAAEVLDSLVIEDHLTEDLKLSHSLLMKGTPAQFVPRALVISVLPPDHQGLTVQRLRWEGGQVNSFRGNIGKMLLLLLRRRFRHALALMDWSTPPLAMATLHWLIATAFTVVMVLLGLAPLWLMAIPAGALFVLIAYLAAGVTALRGPLGFPRLLLAMPRYMVWKLAVYGRMLIGRGARTWQRTPRTAGEQV